MGKFHCDVCNITLATEKWLEEHVNGKSHKAMAAKQQQLKDMVEKSVFLGGFKKEKGNESLIRESLSSFGEITRIIPDKKDGRTAIVEFTSADPVNKLLEQKKVHIGNDKITIKKRLLKFDQHNPEAESTSKINQFEVISSIQGKLTGDAKEDLQKIYEIYRRDSTEFIDDFVAKLSAYVKEYFDYPVELVVFGSTATGMALFDSDVDLCFVSTQPDGATSSNGFDFTVDLMAQNIADLHKSKIQLGAFNVLDRADKIKLLTRIFNEYRKKFGTITSITCVPDARCPVIRFIVFDAVKDHPKLHLNFEVSINNFLGVHKSQFTKKALNEDLSLILFAIRLWARCFNMLKDSSDASGYWTSYAISLIFVTFCQVKGFISGMKVCGTETINGWNVEYEVEELPTFSCTLDEFLLEFFKFAATTFNNPNVLSPRTGRVYSVDEFKDDFKGDIANLFKVALVNIQDPIELTHNVAANVNSAYLKNLRGQCMRVICNLKADPSQPIFGLFAKQAQPKEGKSKPTKDFNPVPSKKRRKFD